MRVIRKKTEPKSLIKHRKKSHSNFDNYAEKQDLRDKLVEEQGYICAYCNCRIVATESQMKIEHYHCQDFFPQLQLTFTNLLAVCRGGEGQSPRLQHCDTRKGNKSICKNPSQSGDRIEDIVFFLDDGTIFSTDSRYDTEINTILNLNLESMKGNRKSVLDAFILSLPKMGELKKADVQRKINEWYQPQNGYVHQHCMIVVHWLRKRLKRMP
ncbi:MAG: hypothetical protein RLZZ156_1895 [Deinococcota bacterium]